MQQLWHISNCMSQETIHVCPPTTVQSCQKSRVAHEIHTYMTKKVGQVLFTKTFDLFVITFCLCNKLLASVMILSFLKNNGNLSGLNLLRQFLSLFCYS